MNIKSVSYYIPSNKNRLINTRLIDEILKYAFKLRAL